MLAKPGAKKAKKKKAPVLQSAKGGTKNSKTTGWGQQKSVLEDEDGNEYEQPIISFQKNAILGEEKPYPDGLFKQQGFLSKDEQDDIVSWLDMQEWKSDLRRRTQQYGFKFNYDTGLIDNAPPMPDKFDFVIHRLCNVCNPDNEEEDEKLLSWRPNQLIVNEYQPGEGINPHVDREVFDDSIITISMLSDIQMIFTPRDAVDRTTILLCDPSVQSKVLVPPLKENQVGVWLEAGSLAVMRRESRYQWAHEIPQRRHDMHNGAQVGRKRRVSLTFRKVLKQCEPSPTLFSNTSIPGVSSTQLAKAKETIDQARLRELEELEQLEREAEGTITNQPAEGGSNTTAAESAPKKKPKKKTSKLQ